MENKFGFCILHFGNPSVTKECVDSIYKFFCQENIMVVVVDNGANNTGCTFDNYYSHKNFFIINSVTNLGFSNGNNLGIDFLKTNGCEFVFVLNNDILFLHSGVGELITDLYHQKKFAVAGPMICTKEHPMGGYDNPGEKQGFTKKQCNKILRYYYFELFMQKICVYNFFHNIKQSLRGVFLKKRTRNVQKDILKNKENVILNGCCFVLTPIFFDYFQHLNGETFMYLEEFILFEEVTKIGLSTLYISDFKIFHNHQCATNQTFKNQRSKRIFQLTNQIKSLKIYKKILIN